MFFIILNFILFSGRKDDSNITLHFNKTKVHMLSTEISGDKPLVSTDMYFDFDKRLARIHVDNQTK